MRHPSWLVVLATALALALAASGCDCSGTLATCGIDADCADGLVCRDGVCVASGADAGGGGGDAGGQGRDGGGGGVDSGTCRDISAESTLQASAVDIIVIIDNSGSMTEEAIQTRDNMNRFAEIIDMSGLDYRVVLISRPGETNNGVCIPAPLGSGMPECVSGPEGRLLAVHQAVASRNAPDLIISLYPMYRDFLRPEAVKAFIWITDDESRDYTADSFRAALAGLEPEGMFDRQIHNAIVGFYGDTPDTWSSSSAGSCSSLARVGSTYLRLAQCLTNSNEPIEGCIEGRSARVCEPVWTSIFEDIAAGVIAGVPVACDFEIPEPPEEMTLNLDDIRLTYEAGDGTRNTLDRAATEAACSDRRWHFDDPDAPTRIILCPDLCRAVQADEGARIDIGLGCFPVLH